MGSDDYSGGAETVRFFTALGFSVEYNREVHVGIDPKVGRKFEVISTNTDTKGKKSSSGTKKSIFLQKLLEQRFGCVVTEAKFDWLVVPDYISMDDVLRDIYDKLIKHLKLNTPTFDLETAIEELAWDFSCVQKAYYDWAKQFDNHEDAISGLNEKGIDGSRCQKQHSFTLHSSNWNPITLSILYALVPDSMARMKDRFDKIVLYTSEPKNHLGWYLLYFIHPVRHELYYFDIHYPDGYSARLASLIRVHRLGLKGAKTYLSKEGRTTSDSYIRACGTTAFKHLHLHPTTSALGKTKRI